MGIDNHVEVPWILSEYCSECLLAPHIKLEIRSLIFIQVGTERVLAHQPVELEISRRNLELEFRVLIGEDSDTI